MTTPSPSLPNFPRPTSPTKPELKPNPHPYAIKTTSTGALSRSNSSPHNSQASRTHYVPPSPVPSPSPSPIPGDTPSRSAFRGHRYSKSLSSDGPVYSPTNSYIRNPSPSPSNEDVATPHKPTRRPKRAETLQSQHTGDAEPTTPSVSLEDLPSNPKLWTPSQLSSYLNTALRIKSGEALSLPVPVTRDIALFVRETGITGKAFLRLNEGDLEGMGVNKLWCKALITASRNLRQNVLKGRIWGFGSGTEEEETTPNNRQARRPSDPRGRSSSRHGEVDPQASISRKNNPFSSNLYTSSTSSVDLSRSPTSKAKPRYSGGHRNGRVKGMVESFETESRKRESSASGNEEGGRAWGHGNRERSGSVSSLSSHDGDAGQSESQFPTARPVRHKLERDDSSPEGIPTGFPSRIAAKKPSTVSDTESEPTMEALLAATAHDGFPSATSSSSAASWITASEGNGDSTIIRHKPSVRPKRSSIANPKTSGTMGGAHAWENADDLGVVTVKRIPASTSAPGLPSTLDFSPPGEAGGLGDAFSWSVVSHPNIKANAKAEASTASSKEVVAALAGGSRVRGKKGRLGVSALFDSVESVKQQESPEDSSPPSLEQSREELEKRDLETENQLQGSINETKSLLETFRRRLEEVERRVEEMGAREMERSFLDAQAAPSPSPPPSNPTLPPPETRIGLLLKPYRLLATIFGSTSNSSNSYPLLPSTSPTTSSHVSSSRDRTQRPRDMTPTTISGLPSYVILVSLGMCAVVLRVLVRRIRGLPVGRI